MSARSSDNRDRLGRLVDVARLAVWSVGRGVIEFHHSSNLTYASSIAYYSLLSIFPFSLLVLAVLGQVSVGDNGNTLLTLLARALPAQVEFLSQIETLSHGALSFGVAGTILLLWASMGVFGALTSAVNHAWGVEKPPGFFKHKLIAFVMMMTAGVLMVVALLIVTSAQVLETTWFVRLADKLPWLDGLRSLVIQNAATVLFMLVVGLVYYYAPTAKVRLRDVWVGAVVAGLLWRGAFALFSWYLRDLSRFSIHGSIATVIAFLIWVYASAVILLYGAEVSAVYAKQLRKQ